MSLEDVLRILPGRIGLAARLPDHLDDLRGPVSGVIRLPRNLAWPGLRECDVSDGQRRRAMYTLLLEQGTRNDIARLVNAALLSQDWPLISKALRPGLRRSCERRFSLGPAASQMARQASMPASEDS
jgi:hypothetical protein